MKNVLPLAAIVFGLGLTTATAQDTGRVTMTLPPATACVWEHMAARGVNFNDGHYELATPADAQACGLSSMMGTSTT